MEKEQDLLEDEIYPSREDVPAELWGRPIPKVRDYEDSNLVFTWLQVLGMMIFIQI